MASELEDDPRRLRDEPDELSAGALRLSAFEGGLRGGVARALDTVLRVHRKPVARRRTPGGAPRRRVDRARGGDLRVGSVCMIAVYAARLSCVVVDEPRACTLRV